MWYLNMYIIRMNDNLDNKLRRWHVCLARDCFRLCYAVMSVSKYASPNVTVGVSTHTSCMAGLGCTVSRDPEVGFSD
jgi:hypothetical protein